MHFVVGVDFFDSAGMGSRRVALAWASRVRHEDRKALPARGERRGYRWWLVVSGGAGGRGLLWFGRRREGRRGRCRE